MPGISDILQRGMVAPRAMGLGAPPPVYGGAAPEMDPDQECYLRPGEAGMQQSRQVCSAVRVQLVGGALSSAMVDPRFRPFERVYRVLPEQGMFDPGVNPSAPFFFDIGAFQVTRTMSLAIFDLRPDLYRFSGIDPGDFVPMEARRFSSCMGFDVTVDDHHSLGDIQYQLDPHQIQWTGSQAYAPSGSGLPLPEPDVTAANSFASAAGAGLALQPFRSDHFGANSLPFMLLIRSGQTVRIRGVVFWPILTPIAFVEYGMAGLLIPEKIMDAYLTCAKPIADVPR